jgi:hypothetical protein
MKKTKLEASTNTIKKVKPIVPVWKHLASESIKDDTWSLSQLLTWIKEKVPEGTKDEDISLWFYADEEPTYYDETIISVHMSLSVKKQNE